MADEAVPLCGLIERREEYGLRENITVGKDIRNTRRPIN